MRKTAVFTTVFAFCYNENACLNTKDTKLHFAVASHEMAIDYSNKKHAS